MDNADVGPPDSHHNLLLGLGTFVMIEPLSRSLKTVIKDLFFFTCHYSIGKWIIPISQMKRRTQFKTSKFHGFMWNTLLDLFHLVIFNEVVQCLIPLHLIRFLSHFHVCFVRRGFPEIH